MVLSANATFLNELLDEMAHVTQPPDFVIQGEERKVYKLHNVLYGLKQTPRPWNKKIDSYLGKLDSTKCKFGYGVYVQATTQDITSICLYVDDLLVTLNNINNL